jgi:hypothetical protein
VGELLFSFVGLFLELMRGRDSSMEKNHCSKWRKSLG